MIEVNIQIRQIGAGKGAELNLTVQEFKSLKNVFNALATTEEIRPSRLTDDDLIEILKSVYEE